MVETKSLPPFNEYAVCPKCGNVRGPETKPLVSFHDGGADGRGETCELGGAQDHLHRKCPRCSFEWAEACVEGAEPLTGAEISAVRELLAEIRK